MGTLALHSGDPDSAACKPEIHLLPPGRLTMKLFPLEDTEKWQVGKETTTTHAPVGTQAGGGLTWKLTIVKQRK